MLHFYFYAECRLDQCDGVALASSNRQKMFNEINSLKGFVIIWQNTSWVNLGSGFSLFSDSTDPQWPKLWRQRQNIILQLLMKHKYFKCF
jgi:hypothetical protein